MLSISEAIIRERIVVCYRSAVLMTRYSPGASRIPVEMPAFRIKRLHIIQLDVPALTEPSVGDVRHVKRGQASGHEAQL